MRFRNRAAERPGGGPPTLLTGRDRGKLARLGIALLLVLAGIKTAADPATWSWLFADAAPRAGGAATDDMAYAVVPEGGDPRPEEFRLAAAPDAAPTRDDALVPAGLLSEVKDNTLTFSEAERDAYFAVLKRLREADPSRLAAAAERDVSFAVLNVEPDHFRGRLVTLDGTARRIVEIPAGANDAGFGRLYELWVFTADGGLNPWRVVAADLDPALLSVAEADPALRQGTGKAGVPVRLTGVFFKRQGYETTQHALHVAPLLLAKSVDLRPGPAAGTAPDPAVVAPWIVGGMVLAVAAAGLTWLRLRAGDRKFERTTLRRLAAKPDFEPSAEGPTDPAEFLKALEAVEPRGDAAAEPPRVDDGHRMRS